MIVSNDRKRYHRVATVRKLEGMSAARAATRLGVPTSHIERLEDEHLDLPISLLYAWHRALEVPMSELMVDTGDSTPNAIWDRAKLLKAMKTVASIREVTDDPEIEAYGDEPTKRTPADHAGVGRSQGMAASGHTAQATRSALVELWTSHFPTCIRLSTSRR